MGKQQARRMWESLLYAVAVKKDSPQATAAVEGLVRSSLEAAVAAAKKGAQGKAVVETPSGFVMCRSRSAMRAAAPGAVPVEGVTAEAQQLAIQESVALRVEEMRRLVGLSSGEEDEEGEDV